MDSPLVRTSTPRAERADRNGADRPGTARRPGSTVPAVEPAGASSHPGRAGAAPLLTLQGAAGNRAVARMIAAQRQSAAPATTDRGPAATHEAAPPTPSGDFLGPGWRDVGRAGLVYKDEGVKLRDRPLPGEQSAVLARLPQNTRVMIVRSQPAFQWYAVRVLTGRHAGAFGYAVHSHVRDDLPDPKAVMYRVPTGETLGHLVQNHRQYEDYDIRTGDDARSLAMAVYAANKGSGVTFDQERYERQDDAWEQFLDLFDEYRAQMRRVYQSVGLDAGALIWLPGRTYIEALKGSGIIPTRPEWKNAAIEVGKGIAGFTTGVVDGLLSGAVDTVKSVYGLGESAVDLVVDIVSGEALKKAQELYDWFANLTPAELGELAEAVVGALVSAVAASAAEFRNKWTRGTVYDIWHFRGRVVGTVLFEVAMMLLSGGTANAAKWLGKFGRLGRKLESVLDAAGPRIERARPGGRRRRDDDTAVGERAIVLAEARAVAEASDAADLPVPAVLAALQPLTRRSGVRGFDAQPTIPGHYRILMRSHVVDDDYTPGAAPGPGREQDLRKVVRPLDHDTRTAGTGGIHAVEAGVNGLNETVVEIHGEILPKIGRQGFENALPAPSRIDELKGKKYDRAHLWGRQFGDEAAAGVMYAPAAFNGGAQRVLEDTLKGMRRGLGPGQRIVLRAKATSFDRSRYGGAALRRAEYDFRVLDADGRELDRAGVVFDLNPPEVGGWGVSGSGT